MNKVLGSTVRTVLQVGGAVLATSGILPATCQVTDPTLAGFAGVASVLLGGIWGKVSASHHQSLKDEVKGKAGY